MKLMRREKITPNIRDLDEREGHRGDHGDTLIEVLIALVILSITVVSLLVAFSAAFSSSATHRNLAVTDTVLRSVAEQVYSSFQQTSTPVFVACPTAAPAYYNGALSGALVPPPPYTSSYSASITSVNYWSGADFSLTTSTCTSGTTVPQQLTIQVLGPQGQSESEALVVGGSGQIIAAQSVQINAPIVASVTPPLNTVGGLSVTFTGSSNAPSGQTYNVMACLDPAMSLYCTSNNSYVSGSNILGLIPGTTYYVTVTAPASTGYLSATSSESTAVSSGTTITPTVTSILPSTTLTGTLVITYSGISNPQNGQTYTAMACSNSEMTDNCVSDGAFASGSNIGGLIPGTKYYVTVRADVNGSTPAATSVVSSPAVPATAALIAPSAVVGTPSSTVSGVINVSFTGSSNAPQSQLYTATACTDSAMSNGCVSVNSFTSGAQVAGLTPGTTYYITIGANASRAYLAATSGVTSGVMATVALVAPSISSTSSGAAGTASINYNGSPNAPSGQTYGATLCTSSTMTSGCRTVSPYASGGTITGLTSGTGYYVTISANASTGYLAATSSVGGVSVS
ncbi:MAG TPA: prepilin-type N-terminal cleavage/methylation domain-containing protein [Acidimicrobiales bacterium]|nr:prepilin-type N-terminal cleavage/methylation domain-containing protein [Acidimicrobiales bacterium]